MEFRNDKLSRFIVIAIAIGANLFLPFELMPIEEKEIGPLIGFLILLDILVLYFALQSTLIKIDGAEIALIRKYVIKWIKPEETRIRLGSITQIKRVRGKRGGPTYSIYFQDQKNKIDKVTVSGWDIEEPDIMAEELSRRARVEITDSWFY